MVAARAPNFPCIEALEWIISHVGIKNCIINDEQGKYIGTFLLLEISKYEKLLKPDVLFNTNFETTFLKQHDVVKIVVSMLL
jgi:hypothetical protein